MEDTSKKRGRAAAKAVKAAPEPNLEAATEQIVAEPLKGKGKRKAAVGGALDKAEKKTVAKKTKSKETVPAVEHEDAEPPTLTESKVTLVRPSRAKKETAETVVVEAKEPKSKRKTAAPKASAATETKKVSPVEEDDAPRVTKRARGKASYKEDDLDEPEYVPKPTKGRAKPKDKDDETNGTDLVTKRKAPAKKTQSKADPAETTTTAKPTARGRKKAEVAEATENARADDGEDDKKSTIDVTEEPKPSNGVTMRKRSKEEADKDKDSKAAELEAVVKGKKPKVAVEPDAAPKGKKAKVAAPKMNKCATDYGSISFEPEVQGKPWNYKISSWNVAGLRSWVGKGGLEFMEHERPDILCVQETKCTEDQLPDEARHIPGYHPYWLCKPGGYAGVAIYSKKMPFHVTYGLGDAEQDQDGRLLTAEYEKFYLVCVYVPNAGNKLVNLPKRMRWDEKFHQYLAELNSKKPVILCGDMNVAHEEIDLTNPKTNRKNAGFTQEERDGMSKLLSLGFVDSFRALYPDRKSAYTFWTYMGGARAKNVGWRLDYFILSERLADKVTDNVIRSQVYGSDHCPVTLFLNM